MVKPPSLLWRQVITVHADGSISGLQRKNAQGLDLRQFGHADIKRASEVTWNSEAQAWAVQILDDDHGHYCLTATRLFEVSGFRELPAAKVEPQTGILFFSDYDKAVDAEIFFLDSARLAGSKPN